jgi:hypothetical protein
VCATIANARCSIFATCAPNIFRLSYENMSLCVSVATKACTDDVAAGDNGVQDPLACTAAVTASCDAFFASVQTPPAACKRKTGTVPDAGKCKFDSQCGAGEYCYYDAMGCGTCQQGTSAGGSCTVDHDCNTDLGLKCAESFVAGPPPSGDGMQICQAVSYGGAGAACYFGTNKQCTSGFGCANGMCVARLATGAPCDGAAATLCDARLGDSCQPDPAAPMNHVCTPIHVVLAGAQCGNVGTPPVFQLCSAYALCSGSAPTVCSLRVPEGAPCTATPDNCYPGFTCMAGMCTAPSPPVCP